MAKTTSISADYNNKNMRLLGFDINPFVFFVSSGLILFLVVFTLVYPVFAAELFGKFLSVITTKFNWLMTLLADVFVLIAVVIMFSPYGKVRLGGAEAKPDFGYTAWIAMLFAAGTGIGLVFFGVSEPLSHFTSSVAENAGQIGSYAPLGGAAGDIVEAKRISMAASIMHWTFHPWAIYALVGLSLALSSYNFGLPLTIRSGFYPIFGNRVWGLLGNVIDTLAVIATVFGLATSLGLGAQQALSGLNFLFGVEITVANQIILAFVIASITVLSLYLGLKKGVRLLSEINMGLAALLLIFVVIAGPTALIFTDLVNGLVAYVQKLPALSNPFGRSDQMFFNEWTTFYWAWWSAWAPFVGMFVARISRGRTVREFIFNVLLVPSIISVLWMTAFGSVGIDQVSNGHATLADAALQLKLFVMLEQLPLTSIASFVGIILILVFFVTSWDSGALVLDTISAGGKLGTSKRQRIFWVVIVGAVASALLIGGGLKSLQSASIITGLPFMVIISIMCIGLFKGLARARKEQH